MLSRRSKTTSPTHTLTAPLDELGSDGKSHHGNSGLRCLLCMLAVAGTGLAAFAVAAVVLTAGSQAAVGELLGGSSLALPTWAPLTASVSSMTDVQVTTGCIVDWQRYRVEPWSFPTFDSLAVASGCGAECSGCRSPSPPPPAPLLPLSGIVFHDGGPAAEVLSAMLASNPAHRVYLQGTLLGDVLRQCQDAGFSVSGTLVALRKAAEMMRQGASAPEPEGIGLRRGATSAAGPGELEVPQKLVFIVLPPEATAHIDLYALAFEGTPWAFVYEPRNAGGVREFCKAESSKAGSENGAAAAAFCERLAAAQLLTVADMLSRKQDGVALPASWIAAGGPRLLARQFGVSVPPPDEFRMRTVASAMARQLGGRAQSSAAASAAAAELPGSAISEAYAKVAAAARPRMERVGGPFSPRWSGEVDPEQPWLAGLNHLADPDAPMWLSSEVFSEPMEPFNCPDKPSKSYPREYSIQDMLKNWPADEAGRVPPKHYLSICRFDYETDLEIALAYRDAEVPFIVYNVPAVDTTVRRWSDPEHLVENIDRAGFRTQTERSVDNHFMYHTGKKAMPAGWTPPTTKVQMSYAEWLSKALQDDAGVDDGDIEGKEVAKAAPRMEEGEGSEHYYFRVSEAAGVSDGFVARAMSILAPQPGGKSTFFLKDPAKQKGIHCRFGMHGVIAEAHHDGSRNMVAMVSGKRRWVLSHPRNCVKMHVYPKDHPSARHSAINWSAPDPEQFPNFKEMMANEVVLRAGEVLYVPTDWIHFIVSLGINAQCNARSGIDDSYSSHVQRCAQQA